MASSSGVHPNLHHSMSRPKQQHSLEQQWQTFLIFNNGQKKSVKRVFYEATYALPKYAFQSRFDLRPVPLALKE
jgi:hypothetical protein